MTEFLRRTWAEIDLDALSQNVLSIRASLHEECKLMCIVKADAYGHGDRYCAAEMERSGADWFGVSNLEEALSLRSCGISKPILVLGITPPELAATLGKQNITQTVFSPEYAALLQREAEKARVQVRVHIKIDTGMGRLGFDGFDCEGALDAIRPVVSYPNLICEGAFTHFSCADESSPDSERYTRAQYARFMGVLGALEQAGIRFSIRHCCNSAATLRYPEMHLDMVRPGIILYGMYPDECCKGPVTLMPAMSLKSVVSMVKEVPAGRDISYGRIYRTAQPTRIATIPIGYADGYHRALSGRGEMLIHGHRAPVIGRVCMDQLMLDISGIDGVLAGDEVVILGNQGKNCITVEQMAAAAGSTFNYEIVCLIGKRVPRVYLRGGRICGMTQYHSGTSVG